MQWIAIGKYLFWRHLIPDIPAFGKFNHGKFKEGNDRNHLVDIDPNSALFKIIGTETGEVNSAHHQSVDMPGFELGCKCIVAGRDN